MGRVSDNLDKQSMTEILEANISTQKSAVVFTWDGMGLLGVGAQHSTW